MGAFGERSVCGAPNKGAPKRTIAEVGELLLASIGVYGRVNRIVYTYYAFTGLRVIRVGLWACVCVVPFEGVRK